jgi:1-acyl-sn-glycerol-3-phosphate acyltransferase
MELGLRRRKKGTDFKPPRESQFVPRLMCCLLPAVSRIYLKISGFDVDEESLERVERLKGERAVLMPNHPTDKDAAVMFYLSKVLGERFYYLAARELFDFGPVAWILQRCGVYSVRRGVNDRKSFNTTVQLLVEGRRRLVIFPEGMTCWQNDTILPFQEGVPLFGFWALDRLMRERPVSLYLVPIAIKYVYARNMYREIDRALARLEKRLSLCPQDRAIYPRLQHVGEAVLSSAEREYGVRPGADVSFDQRLQNMKEILVERIAGGLGVRFSSDQILSSRIRTLVNTLNEITQEERDGSKYQMELHQQRREEVDHLFDDLSRVLHFVATYDGYVRETMSTERFFDVIGQLEREVFGKRWSRGPCRVYIRVGEPVNLAAHYDEYRSSKRDALSRVTRQMEERVRGLLTGLGRNTIPLTEGGRRLSFR